MVIGYGQQKKSVVTGSIVKINSEELERSKDTRIEQALQGRTSGVMIWKTLFKVTDINS